jgi:fucose permease
VSVTLLILVEAKLMTASHLSAGEVITLTVLSGFALAPIYPLIVSFLLARTGNHPRLGPLFASASIGGAALPWLTGIVSTHFRELRTGFVVPAAGAALLLVLSFGLKRRGVDTRFEEMQAK